MTSSSEKEDAFSLWKASDVVGTLTAYWRNDLIQQLHACALPDGLDDGSKLLVGLLKVSCSEEKATNIGKSHRHAAATVTMTKDDERHLLF